MNHISFLIPVALIIWGLYRRIRRSVGLQLIVKRRLYMRIILFSLLALLALSYSVRHHSFIIYDVLGVVLGGILLTVSIRTTTYEEHDQRWHYRPNTKVGIVIIVLFVYRIVYRMYFMYQMMTMENNNYQSMNDFSKDPFTIAVLCLLVTYYIGFNIHLIRKTNTLTVSQSNQ